MYYARNSYPSLLVDRLNGKPSALSTFSWCMASTGYWISSTNSNIQQQQAADYRQTSKSLPGASPPTRMKTTTNRIYIWQFKYANTMPTVLCTSNGLSVAISLVFTSDCRQKKHHITCHVKFVTIYWNLMSSTLYTIC